MVPLEFGVLQLASGRAQSGDRALDPFHVGVLERDDDAGELAGGGLVPSNERGRLS